MPQRKLRTVLNIFSGNLRESRRLAADAYQWTLPGAARTGPHLSLSRRDSLTELAFLRAFLAWETFLEESFILYLSGQTPPRGRPPHRYAFPPNQRAAMEWVVPEGRRYARWTVATEVSARAERLFRSGLPFAPVLRGNQNVLEEARTIRNAIVHESMSAQEKFESLARIRLGTLPSNLTVGRFLIMTVPKSAPPISFLEFYVGRIEYAANKIVPS